jgi:hypothetical protein
MSQNFNFEQVKKKIRANSPRIIVLFNRKLSLTTKKLWVWDPGSEIRYPVKPIPDAGSRGLKGTGSRIQGLKGHRISDPGVKKATDLGSRGQKGTLVR